MAINLFPEASKYASSSRKLIYERKGTGGTIQIWKEKDGSYKQVMILNDGNTSIYDCQKKGNKIKCGSLIYDLKTKKEQIKPVNTKKEAFNKLPITDKLLLKSEETVKNIKKSYSNLFITPLIKWSLIGASAYLLFLFIKKQIEDK